MPKRTIFSKGFTLVELLVAIGIIIILAGVTVAIINPFRKQQETEDMVKKSNLEKLVFGVEAYYSVNSKYPTASEMTPDSANGNRPVGSEASLYISKIPLGEPSSSSIYSYSVSDDQNTFSINVPKTTDPTGCYKYLSSSGEILDCTPCDATNCVNPDLAEVYTNPDDPWECGDPLVIEHASGDVAPVSVTISYATVLTSIGGTGEKCWIQQNLGASAVASSATDSSLSSMGWFWQFNRRQGYAHDGTTRTPNTTWITSINESSNWHSANDPCTLELGAGWRLPTSNEWYNADGAPRNWGNYTDAYNSELKLRAVPFIYSTTGVYTNRGGGNYWSGNQLNTTYGYTLSFNSTRCFLNNVNKAFGHSVRCIKD